MKIIAFTVADQANQKHADKLIKSFHKFHPDIEVKVYNESDIGDKVNYYRSTPLFAKELLNEYDLVLKLDSDQIITGSLDYIFKAEYDIGVVLNWNRVDQMKYGDVSVFDIPPNVYMNCGLVAMRDKKLVDHWWNLCNTYHFQNLRYREQDILNILVHYGDYSVECFDNTDSWYGLISKGEYLNMVLEDGKLVLPVVSGYPESKKYINVLHMAGGGTEPRIGDAYRTLFNEDVIKYIDGLIK